MIANVNTNNVIDKLQISVDGGIIDCNTNEINKNP